MEERVDAGTACKSGGRMSLEGTRFGSPETMRAMVVRKTESE